jgi:hypothetical protein
MQTFELVHGKNDVLFVVQMPQGRCNARISAEGGGYTFHACDVTTVSTP